MTALVNQYLLSVEKAQCLCDGLALFQAIDLEVFPGEMIGILGTSGIGKSRFLECLAHNHLERGILRWGRSLESVPRHRRVGLVYQDFRLVDRLSVLENVLMGALGQSPLLGIMGFSGDLRSEALELLNLVGLSELSQRPTAALSGGEKQRVALARVLLQKPQLILADEPVSQLDEVMAEKCMRLLQNETKKRNAAVVAVIHNRALAEQHCDRTIYLRTENQSTSIQAG